jgi:hypothetical protein
MPNKTSKTVKTSTFKITEKLSSKEKLRKFNQATGNQTRQVERDSMYNPSGRGRFASQYAPFENMAIIETIALPDPSASARSAKARKSREPKLQQSSSPSRSQLLKTRGTQSSAIRKIIK